MSLNVVSLYEPLGVSEHIPASLRKGLNGDIKSASVVQQRYTGTKFVPINGTNFSFFSSGSGNSSSIISFKLTDSMNYLDLQSCYLNMTVAIQDLKANTTTAAVAADYSVAVGDVAGGLNYTVPDDALPIGLWGRGRVSVNSVVVEDIQNLNQVTNALLYSNCEQNVYNTVLSNLIGTWKHNTLIDAVDYKLRRKAIGPMYRNSPSQPLTFSVPLSLLFPSFCSPAYFPLRNAGALQLDLYLDNLKNAILPALSATAGTYLDFRLDLTNVSISADLLSLDPVFVSACDKMIMSDDGFKMPVSTYLLAKTSYPITAQHTAKNCIFSKATPLLRSMLFFKELGSWVNNSARYSITAFPRLEQGHAYKSMGSQIKHNGQLYPVNPLYTSSEHFRELTKQMGGFNMLSHSIQNAKNYTNYNGYGIQRGGYNATDLAYVGDDIDQCAFTWAMSFDKLAGADDNVTIDGVDTTVSGIITVQFSDANDSAQADTSANLCAAICHTRFLVLANGQAQMIGM